MKEISEKTINAWVHGDEEAWAEITMALYPTILNICSRFDFLNQHDIDDIVQTTMIKVIRARSKAKEIKNFNAYLHTIAKNTCIDHIRKSKESIPLLNPYQELLDLETSPEQIAIDKETLECLMTCIDSLPLLQKQILSLKYVHREKTTKICEMLEISERSFFNHLKAAKQALKQTLELYKEGKS